MDLLEELKISLKEIENKLNEGKVIEEEDMKMLFLKSLIEEETGHGTGTRK